MSSSPAAWKLALAALLALMLVVSALWAAPRRAPERADLIRVVISAVGLYVLGGIASLTHHTTLAGVLYGSGVALGALAAWLSRGTGSDEPPGGGEPPIDEGPPSRPDGSLWVNWEEFDRAFRAYSERGSRDPVA